MIRVTSRGVQVMRLQWSRRFGRCGNKDTPASIEYPRQLQHKAKTQIQDHAGEAMRQGLLLGSELVQHDTLANEYVF